MLHALEIARSFGFVEILWMARAVSNGVFLIRRSAQFVSSGPERARGQLFPS
ncbi:hypothetical protein [Methylocystis sp.]|uniref:hypothetical protein n=1 Tax=Methylocystis sp. TaxID=1911079 RepID=UPI0025CE710E|nr:hypothetical protein [Methylocystis sp.]